MGFFSFRAVAHKATIKPVKDPQILPVSYAMPRLISARLCSPAASAHLPENYKASIVKKS